MRQDKKELGGQSLSPQTPRLSWGGRLRPTQPYAA